MTLRAAFRCTDLTAVELFPTHPVGATEKLDANSPSATVAQTVVPDFQNLRTTLRAKNLLQPSLRRFSESFVTKLPSDRHASGFSNRVLDFSKEPVGRPFEFRYASRMQFRHKGTAKSFCNSPRVSEKTSIVS